MLLIDSALDMDDVLIEAKKNSTKARNARNVPYDNYQELEVVCTVHNMMFFVI